MNSHIFFVNFPRTEAIENFAERRLLRVLNKFRRARVSSSDIWFQMENSPQHAGKDAFSCEVRLQTHLNERPIFIKKTAENLYDAIVEVSNVLRNQLSRLHDRIVAQHGGRQSRNKRNLQALGLDPDSSNELLVVPVPARYKR